MLSPELTSYSIALGAGLVMGLALTPPVRAVARRIGFVDNPDGGRKAHKLPVALGGGVAVFLALLVGAAVGAGYPDFSELTISPKLGSTLLAAALTVLLGLVDDAFTLRGRYKLLGQIAIAMLLVASGLQIEVVGVFGADLDVGWLSVPLTVVWILAAINAINLIDGVDGMASSVGVVVTLTVAALTGMLGYQNETVLLLAMAGALVGFLRYNWAPASIYLGDAGSMLIGLMVGVLSISASVKSSAAVALIAPVAILSIPILDSGAAILRRKLTGRSLFAADRGHLHHSLLVRGWSAKQATVFVTMICSVTCLGALLSVLWSNEMFALLTVLGVISFLVSTRTFGHVEVELIKQRVSRSAMSLMGRGEDISRGATAFRLQGSREWHKLWEVLIESAADQALEQLKLSINIPALHEVYFGKWQSPATADKDREKISERCWRVVHPLVVDGEQVGHLEIAGLPQLGGAPTPVQIARVLEALEPIERDVRVIREQIEADQVLELKSPIRKPLASPTPAIQE